MSEDIGMAFVNANQGAFNAFHNAMVAIQTREHLRSLAANALGAKLSKDGDQWCYLLGEDIQSGCCGFGETPEKAAYDFEKMYYRGDKKEASDE